MDYFRNARSQLQSNFQSNFRNPVQAQTLVMKEIEKNNSTTNSALSTKELISENLKSGSAWVQSHAVEYTDKAIDTVKTHKKEIGIVTVGVVVGFVATPVVLSVVGFGSAGVTAGTIAAKTMAVVGPITKGSVYAFCQSAGVVGASATTKAAVGATVGIVGTHIASKY